MANRTHTSSKKHTSNTPEEMKGMQLFKGFNDQEPDDTKISLINTWIKVKVQKFTIDGETYSLYTYTLNIKRFQNEDNVYSEHPELLDILPRACSLLVSPDETLIEPLFGPRKFAGYSSIDEDPEDDAKDDESQTSSTIFDYNSINKWSQNNELEITETTKENGKFAITRIIRCSTSGKLIIICGSKNNHVAFLLDDINEQIKKTIDNLIMIAILNSIKDNLDKLTNQDILDSFAQGYSLVGELCDGQHFCAPKNGIVYFGLFKNGNAMNTKEALAILQKVGIQTVDFNVVFSPESDPSTLDNVFTLSRCKEGEGSVLYCKNIQTGEIILVKSKSVRYIVWRMFRQVLLKGYKNIENIIKRFIETSSYHNLSTEACIRIVRQLIDFGLWMISKEYPCSILGHTPVESVRGYLPNGFYTYWSKYIADGNPDISVTPADFGSFDAEEFSNNSPIYKKRSYNDSAYVFFLQGIQGSGKSTQAAMLRKTLEAKGFSVKCFEQDTYWGDTLACQGAIFHAIARADAEPSKPTIIIISRCNVNQKQYDRYLEMLYKLPCVISFISHDEITPLYLMVALSGIIKRSTKGDNLMVGRREYPIDKVIEFTQENYKNFERHSLAWTVSTYTPNAKFAEETNKLETPEDIQKFIDVNFSKLDGLRQPLDEIVDNMSQIILKTVSGDLSHIVYNSKPIYVGCAINPDNKESLIKFVNDHNPRENRENFTTYLHHCTIDFMGGKKGVSSDQVKPGQRVNCTIDALVIRKSDGTCAFRVSSLTTKDGHQVKTTNKCLHITAIIPSELKPMCANDFVGNTDDSVTIILCNYKLECTCFYN